MNRILLRRPRSITVLAAGLLVLAPAGGQAFDVPAIPFAPRSYICPPAAVAPVIDGRLDDPAWAAAPWTAAFVDIAGPSQAHPYHDTRVKMTWDNECFYIGARLEEPHVWATLTARDAVIYQDNDFEVFIDPDGDNHLYYELEINALGTEWDLLVVKPYRDGGPAINAWDIQGLRTAVSVEGTLNDPADLDQGWSVEMAIPWKVLAQAAGRPAPPRPGDVWRVNFSRVQWRTRIAGDVYVKEPGPEHNWVWSPQGLVAMHYPEMWGAVEFGGTGAPAPTDNPEHMVMTVGARLMPVYYLQRLHQQKHGRYAADLAALGLPPGRIPRWDVPPAQGRDEPLPAGWQLSLETAADCFVARLVTPYGSFAIDQDGQLKRIP